MINVIIILISLLANGLTSFQHQDFENRYDFSRSRIMNKLVIQGPNRYGSHTGLLNFPHLEESNRTETDSESQSKIRANESYDSLESANKINNYSITKAYATYEENRGEFNERLKPTRALHENEPLRSESAERCRTECPGDHVVTAIKGNDFVILPHPCPNYMWNHISGPRPGSEVYEGVHAITGTLRYTQKFCTYKYQVLVRRCESVRPRENDTIINCSKNNVWGSTCTVSCGEGKVATGPTQLECLGNLTWSVTPPECRAKIAYCSVHKLKTNSKIQCRPSNTTQMQGLISPGSICKFNKNGRNVLLICKKGTWRIVKKTKIRMRPKNTAPIMNEKSSNISTGCTHNPCQNGGICLESEINREPAICMCRPETRGLYCEKRECDTNICLNHGLCYLQDGEKTCYCMPNFTGDKCQYFKSDHS